MSQKCDCYINLHLVTKNFSNRDIFSIFYRLEMTCAVTGNDSVSKRNEGLRWGKAFLAERGVQINAGRERECCVQKHHLLVLETLQEKLPKQENKILFDVTN